MRTGIAIRTCLTLILAALVLSPESTSEGPPRISPGPKVASAQDSSAAATRDGSRHSRQSKSPIGVRSRSNAFTIYSRPAASHRELRIDARNPIDQKLVLLVRARRAASGARWYKVLLPERPNGSTGWVRARNVRVVRLHQRIRIDLSDRLLVYFKNGRRVGRYSVGIGLPATPTPDGTFYVWARVPQPNPNGAYGVFALGLSGFSVLSDWPGGGRAAIHGTPNPTDAGRDVSHGCIRVPNVNMRKLIDVPMGTPVTIRA